MILVEDATNPTFYAYFWNFMILFLGLGLKAMNTALTVCNWQLGERIAREHLGEDGQGESIKTCKKRA